MTWWQALLVFIGIPVAVFALVTVVVLRFTSSRVPDGLANALADQQAERATPTELHGAHAYEPQSEDE